MPRTARTCRAPPQEPAHAARLRRRPRQPAAGTRPSAAARPNPATSSCRPSDGPGGAARCHSAAGADPPAPTGCAAPRRTRRRRLSRHQRRTGRAETQRPADRETVPTPRPRADGAGPTMDDDEDREEDDVGFCGDEPVANAPVPRDLEILDDEPDRARPGSRLRVVDDEPSRADRRQSPVVLRLPVVSVARLERPGAPWPRSRRTEEFSLSRSGPMTVEELDLAPMVDVAFQLVLFFMVAAKTVLYKTLEIPKPSPNRPRRRSPRAGRERSTISRTTTSWSKSMRRVR